MENKNTRRGFTLIELLVVVLIIAILAAVALPQYQKAVWKSRNTELKQLVKAIAQVEENYYLAHGQYSPNFNELDLDVPLTPLETTPGARVGACQTGVQGTDSARAGKDFYIVLNEDGDLSKMRIVAYWQNGPYKCAGFGIYTRSPYAVERELHCREHSWAGFYLAEDGAFCEKIEKGTYKALSYNGYRLYQLP